MQTSSGPPAALVALLAASSLVLVGCNSTADTTAPTVSADNAAISTHETRVLAGSLTTGELFVPPEFSGGVANDINDNDVAVGGVGGRAARWLSMAEVTLLPNLPGAQGCGASRVNENGTTLGSCSPSGGGAERVVFWTPTNEVVELGQGRPVGLNNRGDALWNHEGRVFLRDKGGMVDDLGTFGGVSATASGINNRGMIAGVRLLANGRQEAFVWSRPRGLRVIPAPEGSPFIEVAAINEPGHVAGRSARSPCGEVVWFWSEDDGYREVSCIQNVIYGVNDINNDDIIAGAALDFNIPPPRPAVLWRPDGTRAGEWFIGFITGARAVNNLGRAVGFATLTSSGPTRPYVF